jgi:hypothetical protein
MFGKIYRYAAILPILLGAISPICSAADVANAVNDIIETDNPAAVLAFLAESGQTAKLSVDKELAAEVEGSGSVISTQIAEKPYKIYFSDCDSEGVNCGSLQFVALFDATNVTFNRLSEWRKANEDSRASVEFKTDAYPDDFVLAFQLDFPSAFMKPFIGMKRSEFAQSKSDWEAILAQAGAKFTPE